MLTDYHNLFVDRGPPGANMTTLARELSVSRTSFYQIGDKGLALSPRDPYVIDLEFQAAHPRRIETPEYCEMEAIWDETPFESGSINNILGDNGALLSLMKRFKSRSWRLPRRRWLITGRS